MKERILSCLFMMLIGLVIGCTVMPALCQKVGQKMFVGSNSQKTFETFTLEKKLATLNRKLDYLIQQGLTAGYYIDDDGVVQSPIRSTGRQNGFSAPTAGTVRVDSQKKSF